MRGISSPCTVLFDIDCTEWVALSDVDAADTCTITVLVGRAISPPEIRATNVNDQPVVGCCPNFIVITEAVEAIIIRDC